GVVQSFSGEFIGSFLVGGFGLRGDVTVNYKAAQPGTEHAAVAGSFLRSPEAYGKLVGGYYADLLGRPGEAAGVQAWRDAVHAGRLSADQVAEAFLASDEFLAKALAAGGGTASEKYTRALYQSVLGRAATPAELANWVRYLDAGGSRVQMAQA